MTITALIPTRNRKDGLIRILESFVSYTSNIDKLEVIVLCDDDELYAETIVDNFKTTLNIKCIKNPRKLLPEIFNIGCRESSGEIIWLGSDDSVIRTHGWDNLVRNEFLKFEDRMILVYGDDLGLHGSSMATLPFVHVNLIKTLGYIAAPMFNHYYLDLWLHVILEGMERLFYLPDLKIEHMHHAISRSQHDETYINGEKYFLLDYGIWYKTESLRIKDAVKLQKFIESYKKTYENIPNIAN